jgi:hypothetical protein
MQCRLLSVSKCDGMLASARLSEQQGCMQPAPPTHTCCWLLQDPAHKSYCASRFQKA